MAAANSGGSARTEGGQPGAGQVGSGQRPAHEALDPVDRRLGLAQGPLVVLDRRAVVRRAEVVADARGARAIWMISLTSRELPSDLLIFSPPMVTHALCSQ